MMNTKTREKALNFIAAYTLPLVIETKAIVIPQKKQELSCFIDNKLDM